MLRIEPSPVCTIMMVGAMKRTPSVAENIGIIGIFVDAKNQNAREYYEQFGFIALLEDPLELLPDDRLTEPWQQQMMNLSSDGSIVTKGYPAYRLPLILSARSIRLYDVLTSRTSFIRSGCRSTSLRSLTSGAGGCVFPRS